MDRELSENPEIQRLIHLGEVARSCLAHDVGVLRSRFDIPLRIRHSLSDHPLAWCVSSLVSGMAASFIFRRKLPSVKKRGGLPAALLGLALTVVRPLAKRWLGNQVKQWAGQQASGLPAGRRYFRSDSPSQSI
jgi:hypothetical protein